MQSITKSLCENLEGFIPTEMRPMGLHEPCFSGNEWNYVKTCIDTGWVSSTGSFVDRFENDIAKFCNVPYVIVTTNGTSALHVSLLLAGIEPGDEVLVPALTFVASANAIHYCGATAHFIDSSSQDLGINVEKLSQYMADHFEMKNNVCINKHTKSPVKAIMAVHVFGHIGDIEGLQKLAQAYNLHVIEDASEALGSWQNDHHAGSTSFLGVLSFNGNKIMTTGGGGAILATNEALAKKAKHLTTTAKQGHAWAYYHDEVGYNYRLPNINAALGCAQLEQIPNFLDIKRDLAKAYQSIFDKYDEIRFITEPHNCRSNYWLNALLLPSSDVQKEMLAATHEMKIFTRPVWELMSNLPMYKNCPSMDLSEAQNLSQRLLNLPSGVALGKVYSDLSR